jgi:hypothetical protein
MYTAQSVTVVEKTTHTDGLSVQDTRRIVLTSHVLNAEK